MEENIEELDFNNVIIEPNEKVEQPVFEEKEVVYEDTFVEPNIKVYIEINNNDEIIKIFSTAFEDPISSSIYIDEGIGDKYRHAQSQYLPNSLMSEEGTYNYKYINGKIVEK